MEFLVISISVAAFFAALIVFGRLGRASDAKNRRLDYINDLHKDRFYSELELSFSQRYVKKAIGKVTKLAEGVMTKNKVQKAKASDALLERQLRLAGVYMSVQEFSTIKTFVAMASFILFMLLALLMPIGTPEDRKIMIRMLVLFFGTFIGVLGPTIFLRSKVKGHQQLIREQLPDAMDLLGVCIEAGLSFDISLVKVSEKLKGPFVDELLIVHREIQMGRSRRDALQNLAESTDIPELKTFVSALAQAEQLGIPIINVMRIQSVQLRDTRKIIAQEKGMKAPVKMLIPMIIFIFPVIFIILLGPTVINMINQFVK